MQTQHLRHGAYNRFQPAFTLIELLVVIAIIAILASLILPGLARAKEKAYQTKCRSNMHEIATAIMMYTPDNREQLPGPTWSGMFFTYTRQGVVKDSFDKNSYDSYGSLLYYIAAYLGQKNPDFTIRTAIVAQCPSEIRRIPLEAHNPKTVQTPPLGVPVSYVSPFTITNQIVSGKWTFDPAIDFEYPFGRPQVSTYAPSQLMTYTPSQKITKFRLPSSTWAMVDCDYQMMNFGMGGSTSTTYIDFIPEYPVHGKNPGLRNYMYFDGSIRTAKTTY